MSTLKKIPLLIRSVTNATICKVQAAIVWACILHTSFKKKPSQREESDKVLSKRQNNLGKSVYECNTRVVWTDKVVAADDVPDTNEFLTRRSDEDIPEGELNSDED